MSVMDEIRKLDEQKAKLLDGAKQQALKAANDAIASLAEIGFNYTLVEAGSTFVGNGKTATARTTGTRRAGIRDTILNTVSQNPGITRSALLELMDAKGDKSAEQSISNALAALKKAGSVTLDDGAYTAV